MVHEIFQYRLLTIPMYSVNPSGLENQLNELGLEGWYVLSAQNDYLLLERVEELTEIEPSND